MATRLAAAAAFVAGAAAINNGKGVTPPMGWRSWSQFCVALRVAQSPP